MLTYMYFMYIIIQIYTHAERQLTLMFELNEYILTFKPNTPTHMHSVTHITTSGKNGVPP